MQLKQMPTTLISVIGKPRSGRYNHAKYRLHDEVIETDFFFLPLLKHYQPQKFYLIGTQDSIWTIVDQVREQEGFDYESVIVPFGINAEEIWQIFERIVQLPLEGQELIIDITHGFRAIPVAVFMAVLYFQTVKQDVWVKDILYGNYDARDPHTGIAPVVHLTSLLDMNEWIRAARRFVQYGDGDLLIKKMATRLPDEKPYQAFLKAFREFVLNLQLNFVSQIPGAARQLQTTLQREVKNSLLGIPTYRLLHPLIQERLRMFTCDEPEWKKQWRVADWFFRNHQYSQALIVLRETLITFTCNLLEMNATNIKNRESKASHLHTVMVYKDDKRELEKKKYTKIQIEEIQKKLNEAEKTIGQELYDQWTKLILEVSEARNTVGHALMRGLSKNERINPEEQIHHLREWLQESLTIFEKLLGLVDQSKNRLVQQLNDVLAIIEGKHVRVFLIVNEGIHPILLDLQRQYGEDIRYEVITRGNLGLEEELEVVQRTREVVQKYQGAEFVIVPSGLPYLITVVYNTVYQITSKHPIYLQLDREKGCYVEKILDPRKLMI